MKGQQSKSRHVPGLKGEDPGTPVPGSCWIRRTVAAALAATFVVLLPVAVTSAWIRGTIVSTDGYVAAVAPVAANPAVRATVQEVVTAQVHAALSRSGKSLPPAAGVLAGPLSSGLADFAGNQTSDLMASQAFQRVWADVNRFAHSQLIQVLNGDSTLVSAAGGEVVLNLVPLVNDVLHSISASLPSVTAIPAGACRALSRTSSPACAQIPLFPAAALDGPRHAYRVLVDATWLSLILTPLAFSCALAASPRKRRTLLQMSIGGTITLLVILAALSWLRSSLVARADPQYQAVTSEIVHALTNSFFAMTMLCVAGGCVLSAVTLLSGRRSAATVPSGWRPPSRRARSIRVPSRE